MIQIQGSMLFGACVLIAILWVASILYARKQPLTVPAVLEAVKDVGSEARELWQVAMAGVALAEELKRTGEISTGSEAAQHAIAYAKRFYPATDERKVADTVRAAYSAFRIFGGKLPDLKLVGTETIDDLFRDTGLTPPPSGLGT